MPKSESAPRLGTPHVRAMLCSIPSGCFWVLHIPPEGAPLCSSKTAQKFPELPVVDVSHLQNGVVRAVFDCGERNGEVPNAIVAEELLPV
ncbi:Uu.00g145430.m01.CDS01 [Anthostomella pinea]|uniref:Uu.00g145430.m01.CDS01 n=1 Tax=Anthostomella pinea TaxID=933095 RepID=A0AAI8VR26_9PEZI|nr:Uu.00g145430.m01.CDS01 [Anthostomella pinea]